MLRLLQMVRKTALRTMLRLLQMVRKTALRTTALVTCTRRTTALVTCPSRSTSRVMMTSMIQMAVAAAAVAAASK